MPTYGEEQGSRLVRTYAGCFPEAYKEDYPPQTGAVDLGRLEPIEGDVGLRSRSTRTVAAAPGEARLKVFRIGPPLSLSEVLPILSTTGVEVVDERPYQLEGIAGSPTSTTSGCATTGRCPTEVATCSRTPSPRSGTG